MRILNTALTLSMFLLSPLALAQTWVVYQNMADNFSINVPAPGEPEIEEIAYPSEYDAVFPGRVYTVRSGDSTYSVTVIDYTDSEEIHLARTNTTEADSPITYDYWRIDFLASVAYAATNFRTRGGEVNYDAWHHIDRVPGHQLNLTNSDESRGFIGIYLHKTKLYILEARVPKGYPPQGHFQQSLSFLDEQGGRIRYDYAEDGSLVRCCREWR